uniref:Uncharacterized protein n=1 Tax=mine drainage metagenome TaxID=410659 RepID=E6PYB1_9ZZZZ
MRTQFGRATEGLKPAADIGLRVSFAAEVKSAWLIGFSMRPFADHEPGVAAVDDKPVIGSGAFGAADFTFVNGADQADLPRFRAEMDCCTDL